jgi:hypothetical protein
MCSRICARLLISGTRVPWVGGVSYHCTMSQPATFPWAIVRERRLKPDDLLSAGRVIVPPVDVRGLLRWLRVETFQERAPGWAGAARAEGGRAFIWLDADLPAPMQRYVAAHELGHLLLHPLDGTYRCRAFFTRDKVCAEADRFALDLLMPAWMLGPVSPRREAPALAAMFGVSEPVMNRRLLELAGVLSVP